MVAPCCQQVRRGTGNTGAKRTSGKKCSCPHMMVYKGKEGWIRRLLFLLSPCCDLVCWGSAFLEELTSGVRAALSNEHLLSFLMDVAQFASVLGLLQRPLLWLLVFQKSSGCAGEQTHLQWVQKCMPRALAAAAFSLATGASRPPLCSWELTLYHSKPATRVACHNAHRGRVEVLCHDCWNHNILHALKNFTMFSGGCKYMRKWAQGSYFKCCIWCW